MYTNLCRKVWITLGNLKRDERGVTAIEYALLAAGVAIVLAFVLSDNNWFSTIFNKMTSTVGSSIDGITPSAGS